MKLSEIRKLSSLDEAIEASKVLLKALPADLSDGAFDAIVQQKGMELIAIHTSECECKFCAASDVDWSTLKLRAGGALGRELYNDDGNVLAIHDQLIAKCFGVCAERFARAWNATRHIDDDELEGIVRREKFLDVFDSRGMQVVWQEVHAGHLRA